ncbi:MAG: hypothetical protein K8R31_09205, partial [Bacteroidales bacterium]|nr:hypothetical protein [Bacteroidales bacterium]
FNFILIKKPVNFDRFFYYIFFAIIYLKPTHRNTPVSQHADCSIRKNQFLKTGMPVVEINS